MNIDMNKLDNEELEIHTALSQIRVDTKGLALGVKQQLHQGRQPQKFRGKKMASIAAAILAVVVLSTTAFALTMGGFDWFVERINPPFADIVEPIMQYTEDQGIRMTVLGAQNFDNTAIVYVAIQDISGENRLTADIALWSDITTMRQTEGTEDSEGPGFSWGSMGNNLLYFDETSNTAYFELRFAQDTPIPERLTISTSHLPLSMVTYEQVPIPIVLADLELGQTISVSYQYASCGSWISDDRPSEYDILLPGRFATLPDYPDSSWISNIGIVDGQLRVQVINRMSWPFGASGISLALLCPAGELIHNTETIWAWVDEDLKPINLHTLVLEDDSPLSYSLSEYIFDVNPTNLADYTLVFWGNITEGIEGNWQLTLETNDTTSQIITLSPNISVGEHQEHRIEFITISPLGVQIRGTIPEFDRDQEGLATYIEVAGELITSTNFSRVYMPIFEGGRYDGELLGISFSLEWMAESPIDINSVTAIIIEGQRIEIP